MAEMRYTTLKRSAEFKRVRGGVRWAGPLFILEGKARVPASGAPDSGAVDATQAPAEEPRFGFTITKKVGNAVVRNRIRRRLKEALCGLEPQSANADHDYVVVASRAAHDYPFAELQEALRAALQRLQRQATGQLSKGGPARSGDGGGQSKRGAGVRAGPPSARGGNPPTAQSDDQDR